MEVGDSLAGVAPAVDDNPESGGFVPDTEFFRHVAGGDEQVAEDGRVFIIGAGNTGDGFFRNDEHVDGSLGADITEGEAEIVLMDDVGGDFPGDDAFEEGHGATTEGAT